MYARALIVLTGLFLAPAIAAAQPIQWVNPAGGNWNVPGNWNPANVPDAAAESAVISTAGAYTVTFNISPTIGGLTIGNPSAALNIPGAFTLTLAGPMLANEGLIRVDSNLSAANALLQFNVATMISGGGEIRLLAGSDNSQLNAPAGVVVTNTSTHRITGRGQINFELVNNGLVMADDNVLLMQLNPKTNNDRLLATNGGTLQIDAITVTQGAAGRIIADNGAVSLTAVNAIIGGRLETQNGGQVLRQLGGPTTLTSLVNGGDFAIVGGGSVAVDGAGLVNNGLMRINSTNSASNAILQFNVSGPLSGAGTVRLETGADNAQLNTMPGAVITHAATHRIEGRGQINAALTNNGVIQSNVTGSALLLQIESKSNNDRMIATNGGILQIDGITITQGLAGRIIADAGTVNFSGASAVSGGRLQSLNGGLMQKITGAGVTTLTSVTSDADFRMQGGGLVNVGGTGLVNNGLMTVNSTNSASDVILTFAESGGLSGMGEIRLTTGGGNSQLNTSPGATITHAAEHRISGRGQINAALINHGLIVSDLFNSALTLQGENKTNHNQIIATDDGILQIGPITLTQSAGGRIVADGGTVVMLSAGASSVIDGGRIESRSGGLFQKANGALATTLTSVTSDARIDVFGGGTLAINGSGLINNGLIRVNMASASDAIVRFDASGTLSGTGELQLSGLGGNAQFNTAAGATVTQATGHRITGRGQINASLVNNGEINATDSSGTLDLATNVKVNNGTARATGNAILSIGVNVSGSGQWIADSAFVRIPGTAQVTTTGPIYAVHDGTIQVSVAGGLLSGSDFLADATSQLFMTGSVALSGNHIFRTTVETEYQWNTGAVLTMSGGTGGGTCSSVRWAVLEAGGRDNNAAGTGLNNMGLRTLNISAGAEVTLSDFVDNGNRGGPGGNPEALYVTALSIGAGATLNLNGVHLYAAGALVTPGPRGGGTVVNSPVFLAGDMNCDSLVDGEDVQGFVLGFINPGAYPAAFPGCNICAGDIDGDGIAISAADVPAFVELLLSQPVI